jgi:hypothetical protein
MTVSHTQHIVTHAGQGMNSSNYWSEKVVSLINKFQEALGQHILVICMV